MIKRGDVVKFKPNWMDIGDDKVTFIAIEDEDGGRVKVQAQLGLPINPVDVVLVAWIETEPA